MCLDKSVSRDEVPLLCRTEGTTLNGYKSLVSDQISQEVDCNEGGNKPLEEEWHAPAGFSLDDAEHRIFDSSDDLSLKKMHEL